ncbi:MAG: fumarylacetoacetate hydrolase family protein, partial [Acidimicrobiales bacterium]
RFLDYELELAVVIGRQGADLRPDEARSHVFGVTIMNDFSARDLQMREMTASLGPAKGKDFATSIGPWITTMDELDADRLEMVARVNGEEWTRNSMATITWTIDELVAYVSRAETLGPRQVIATDTVGRGSGLELYRKLRPGDVVELDIDGIGTLRNRLAHSVGDRWAPEPKVPRGLTPYRP